MIRAAREGDIPLIQSVLNASANLGKLEAYSDESLKAAIADKTTPILVWEELGKWQGFCLLRHISDGTKIEEFGVVSTGTGVGKRFFSAILEHAQLHGLPGPIWLYVAADNLGAIRFYERFGFVKRSVKKAAWVRRKGPVADAIGMVLP